MGEGALRTVYVVRFCRGGAARHEVHATRFLAPALAVNGDEG
ncbi:hypothetical protein [Streptomyces sp. bgisy084]